MQKSDKNSSKPSTNEIEDYLKQLWNEKMKLREKSFNVTMGATGMELFEDMLEQDYVVKPLLEQYKDLLEKYPKLKKMLLDKETRHLAIEIIKSKT